ncbi:RNA polymerase sigma-70 factor (ECF subfamily) [Chitinophaga skermanii]|uniref:RNA polymerase sigma-70 factor (ECF subfamily) n=1 Tax=Chitinophaga skermanii TaxID=331697 RepID=A0A327QSN1_9BACT|nr:sigma-70 family RNA polymerase sigma factor [Chitinophaga skermanii]RAJ06644.1 RNA polymerase sigma-70 factor (ECF subfamily) [Chitinophaga skermanii]
MPALFHNENAWTRLRGGEEQALFELYKSHYNYLYKCGLKISADADLTTELINQVFMTIWEKRNSLPELQNPKAYLLTTLKNKILKTWEQRKRYQAMLESTGLQMEQFQHSIEEHMLQMQLEADKKQQVLSAIEQLSPRQKELVYLRFYQELSYEQIAERTSLSPRTIYNNIYEALKSLKDSLVQKVLEVLLVLSLMCF